MVRTFEQMVHEREETGKPLVITEAEWAIVQRGWLHADAKRHGAKWNGVTWSVPGWGP